MGGGRDGGRGGHGHCLRMESNTPEYMQVLGLHATRGFISDGCSFFVPTLAFQYIKYREVGARGQWQHVAFSGQHIVCEEMKSCIW